MSSASRWPSASTTRSRAVVVLGLAVRADQAEERRGERAEPRSLIRPAFDGAGVPVQRPAGGGQRFGDRGEDRVPGRGGQRRVDSARHHPGRVDPLAAETFDDLLAEAAQRDPVPGQLRMGRHHAEQVPAGGVGVEAEQQVRGGEVEEAQCVRLHDLGEVHHPPQVGAGRRGLHGEDLVARLGGGDQVADRADAADPGHDRGHLVHRPALHDPLEPAELGDVEVRVGDLSGVVELDGDLRMALDPGHRVDDDLACSSPAPTGRTGRRCDRSGRRPASRSSRAV